MDYRARAQQAEVAAALMRAAVEAKDQGRAADAAMLEAEALGKYAELRRVSEASPRWGAEDRTMLGQDAPFVAKDYGKQLIQRLKGDGFTVGDLWRASGIARSQISRWSNTPMQPTLANVERIETAYAAMLEAKAKGKALPGGEMKGMPKPPGRPAARKR